MAPNGVDLYVGGVEHAVLHLLYARFWHKVLFDLGHVSTPEPFGRLINQGYIQGYAYQDSRGIYVEASEVVEKDGTFFHEGEAVTRSLGKIGKSLKNSVSPDEIFESHGCDTLRLFELSLGPLEQSKPWDIRAIVGVHRFLHRVWRNILDEDTGDTLVTDDAPDEKLTRALHKTIAAVTDDMESMAYNTAISKLIELNNQLVALPRIPRAVAEPLVLMLAPLAPHVCEELWERLGHAESLSHEPWPSYDEQYLVDDTMTIVVQVMGKKRAELEVSAAATKDELEAIALADVKVAKFIEGKTVRKVIYVPGKLVNIVAN
jgi:leucyl-tRNA synthetase